LLYAPQSGKETRAMLKGKATGVVDAIKGKSSGVVDVAEDVASEASRRGHAAVHGPKS
jgi:gas vesicle protein